MTHPSITAISPFFIVADVARASAFYCDKLGFESTFRDSELQPFFAIVRRDGAQLLIKSVDGVDPLPNCRRHPFLRWDAFLHTPSPDDLAAEFLDRGVHLSAPLEDTEDGLRGFEVTDPDGYVLFFGRPLAQACE